MAFDLIRRVESLGSPCLLVVGDLILDRYIWGDAERISQEAPVPLLRADAREHRLGGASSVATMLATLGARVRLVGGVGRDPEAIHVRRMLDDLAIDHRDVVDLDDRPTTLKERYIGRAQDRHPQQMIRVDYETRDPLPAAVEAELIRRLPAAIANSDLVLISDYDKGVCTPRLLRALIDECRTQGVTVVADPIRGSDYSRYAGVHCMTPNRLEAGLATGKTIKSTDDAVDAGRTLVRMLGMDAILVTLDRDGMALVRADGRSEVVPTRPRQVYDITGAGDMVLSIVGLCLADGADYDEAAALGNVAGGLEVEKIGVALLTRDEILRDLVEHQPAEAGKVRHGAALLAEVARRRAAGQKVVFTNGCFDILHRGHVTYLSAAKALGDILVVGVNSDAGIRRLKGPDRPINTLEDRVEVLAALSCVDHLVAFDDDTPERLIEALRPEVFVKGGDYTRDRLPEAALVERLGGEVRILPFVADRSTTRIIERIWSNSGLGGAPATTLATPGANA